MRGGDLGRKGGEGERARRRGSSTMLTDDGENERGRRKCEAESMGGMGGRAQARGLAKPFQH